jgi:hypothetical protein
VIDGFTHEAVESGLSNLPLAKGVAVMVTGDPKYGKLVEAPKKAA